MTGEPVFGTRKAVGLIVFALVAVVFVAAMIVGFNALTFSFGG